MNLGLVALGSRALGLGHVSRSSRLAAHARTLGHHATVHTNVDSHARSIVQSVVDGHAELTDVDDLAGAVAGFGHDALIVDCNDLHKHQVEALRTVAPTIIIAPQGSGKWYSDLTLLHCPILDEPVPDDATAVIATGPHLAAVAGGTPSAEREHVLVFMGGGDAMAFTEIVLHGLAAHGMSEEVVVVVGAANSRSGQIAATTASVLPNARVLVQPRDFPAVVSASSLAILAMGTTTYEAATMGVASVNIPPTEFHARIAAYYQEQDWLRATRPNVGDVASALEAALVPGERERLGKRAAAAVNGGGLTRIIESAVAVAEGRHRCRHI